MGDQTAEQNQVSNDSHPQGGSNSSYDGRLKTTRTTVWAASAHIITALIGSGVLSLAWATAQLGWIFGPIVMLLFSLVTCYTFTLFADAVFHSSGKLASDEKKYTNYMDTFLKELDESMFKLISLGVYYISLFGVASGCTTESSASLNAIQWSKWFHSGGDNNGQYHMNRNLCVIIFCVIQIFFSQIYDFGKLRWVSVLVTGVTSFTYSLIGLCLSVAKVAETGNFRGSLTGISIGTVTETQKIWRTFHAVGVIAYAYSYFIILIEIQDSMESPPLEVKKMKNASVISVGVITLFYMLCGCFGYAAFGDLSPENLLTGLGFDKPFWILEIAKVAIFIHLVGAYQIYCRPLFEIGKDRFNKEIEISIPGFRSYKLKFGLVWRTTVVTLTSVMSMLLPFFNDGVGLLGALGFWPFTVYFPVEMYIREKKITKWKTEWICLQILSFACFIISIAAATGSIAGFVLDLKSFKPFKFGTS
ncbi:amino acid permease 3-like isoform X2 [Pistacia vera]|uniref:amino acid permease 3-like isoform X2 n=1 Tax=Pistacia vera TaxID=55513 RepID=UPI0012638598|nr:amino acid permease 3-like isoform X2 [Pistacia vera]